MVRYIIPYEILIYRIIPYMILEDMKSILRQTVEFKCMELFNETMFNNIILRQPILIRNKIHYGIIFTDFIRRFADNIYYIAHKYNLESRQSVGRALMAVNTASTYIIVLRENGNYRVKRFKIYVRQQIGKFSGKLMAEHLSSTEKNIGYLNRITNGLVKLFLF